MEKVYMHDILGNNLANNAQYDKKLVNEYFLLILYD